MQCSSCGGTEFDQPSAIAALEIRPCRNCGTEVAVHFNYVPDLSNVKLHSLFLGSASIGSEAESLKVLLKLKKALTFAERFEPEKLVEQHRAGKLNWELGLFFDFELERAQAECRRIGLHVSFDKVTP